MQADACIPSPSRCFLRFCLYQFVGLFVGVLDGVFVGATGVLIGVLVGVAVGATGVLIGVLVGVAVGATDVLIGVLDGVSVGTTGVLVSVLFDVMGGIVLVKQTASNINVSCPLLRAITRTLTAPLGAVPFSVYWVTRGGVWSLSTS
jgi:hypothetical protein